MSHELELFMPSIIQRKRNGVPLTKAEIDYVVKGIAGQTIPDSQIAAFAMAVFFQGMATKELTQFTLAMAHSGEILNWQTLDLPGPILDKHSTGGVGDKVTLILVPLIAACGAFMPKMSGRALGHTGGTLDKLDSIPGYQAQISLESFRQIVKKVGCAIVGSTGKLAPADKSLYAVRDVTATVDSLPLIVASILSKKLAAHADYLVLDVKFGAGALLADFAEAELLAQTLTTIANEAGLPTRAVLSDMNQVLGNNVGNALEVQESIDFLVGKHQHPRLSEVVIALASEMLLQSQLVNTATEASQLITKQLTSGRAAECFQAMIAALGGPSDLIHQPERYLAKASYVVPVYPEQAGTVSKIDVRQIGVLLAQLGGARSKPGDPLDYAVGFSDVVGLGAHCSLQDPLAYIHANNEDLAQAVSTEIRAAFTLNATAPTLAINPTIHSIINVD